VPDVGTAEFPGLGARLATIGHVKRKGPAVAATFDRKLDSFGQSIERTIDTGDGFTMLVSLASAS
jgi:hypothetical protein